MLGQGVRIKVTHRFFPDMEMHDRSEQAQLENPSGLAETILKLTEPVVVQKPVSERAVEATERLVAIVAQLRQPGSGWPSDLPMTPENLIPYVSEEAWEVIEALVAPPADQAGRRGDGETGRRGAGEQGSRGDGEQGSRGPFGKLRRETGTLRQAQEGDGEMGSVPPVPWSPRPPHPLYSVAELIPRCLWWTIASSYDAMRLISGVEAVAIPPGFAAEPSSGILRLVVGLNFAPNLWLVDLATQEVLSSKKDLSFLVTAGTLLQSPHVELCREPIEVSTMSQQLQEHLMAAAPTFSTMCNFQPQKVDWLQPHSTWQQGEIFLSLDWQFFPQPDIAISPETALLQPQTWIKTRNHSHQTDFLPSLGFFDKLPLPTLNQIDKRDFIPHIVAAAINVVTTREQFCLIRPAILDAWVPQLFWQVLRNSYDMSMLLEGVAAAVLPPSGEWVAGTLRLVLVLHLSYTNVAGVVVEQEIDLFTGSPYIDRHPLAAGAILQGRLGENQEETLWHISNPVTVAEMLAQIQRPLAAADPFMQRLIDGTAIEMQSDIYSPWCPGNAQLRLELELTPILPP